MSGDRVAAVSMVRDEIDVIEAWVRHMADEVDFLVVADNGSIDGTYEALEKLSGEFDLLLLRDDEVGYYQSRKMSALAQQAAERGAGWIVPADCDELWLGPDRVAHTLRTAFTKTTDIVQVELFNHYATSLDSDDANPFMRLAWRSREPLPLPKVAFRYQPGAVIHMGNHGVSLPGKTRTTRGAISVRHFPYRSAQQMLTKTRNGAQAYAATDLPEDLGAHWRSHGQLLERFGEEAIFEVFREHYWYFSPNDSGLVFDPAPWLRWQR